MIFTVKRRKEIYERILVDYLNDQKRGTYSICSAIVKYMTRKEHHAVTMISPVYYLEFINLFPELLKQKPETLKQDEYWWPSNKCEPRITALQNAILDCTIQMSK